MEEKSAPRCTSEVRVDLTVFQEYLRIATDSYGITTYYRLFQILIILHIIGNLDSQLYTGAYFLIVAFVLSSEWHLRRRFKDGGVEYKQLLYHHNGNIPHELFCFEDVHVVVRNLSTGNERTFFYENYVQIWESKNLLVLITDLNMYQIIDKRTLSGCTSPGLIEFLREKCPNLKKVSRGKTGRLLRRLLWVVLVLGLLCCVFNALYVSELTNLSLSNEDMTAVPAGQFTNETPYGQMIDELAELGIVISNGVIETATTGEVYYMPGTPSYYRVYYLLCWEGQGSHWMNGVEVDPHIPGTDLDALVWTPSTSGVYWFDMEVLDASSIYTDFLTGVDAMDETLTFSNISEDYTGADLARGNGIVTVSFDYLGEHYELQAQYNHDRFDLDMLYEIGCILASDENANDLWFYHDGNQGLLLYYGTPDETTALARKTGLTFYDVLNIHSLY